MKKGLIAGGILLGCVLLLSGIAAADISTSGKVEFQINGDPAGLFGGVVESSLSYSLAAEVDSWTAGLAATVENEGGVLALSDAFIQYTAEMATIRMEPLGVEYGMYDLADNEEILIAKDQIIQFLRRHIEGIRCYASNRSSGKHGCASSGY